MADDVTTQPDAEPDASTVPATPAEAKKTDTPAEIMVPKSRLDELNKKLREIEKREADLTKAAEAAAALAAEEQGQFKTLYETEKAKRESAEGRAKAAELASIKARIGAKLQLPAKLQDRLRGETEEEIEADAKELMAELPRPTAITTNDAEQGLNSVAPTAQRTDAEIREEAARFGVSFEHLKAQYQK